MADFVDATIAEIRKRKNELEKIFKEEYARLEEAEAALVHLVGGTARRTRAAGANARRRAAGRPAAGKSTAKRTAPGKGKSTGKRGRPKGTGKRQAQAVRIVTAAPGITTSEIAKKMGIKPNYLYRVMPELKAEGKVSKNGRGWYPAGK